MSFPRRISKKELAYLFRFYSLKSGRCYPHRLRKEVFTDYVLQELGISNEEYRACRIFNPMQTMKIVSYFNITDDDLHKNLWNLGQRP